MKRDSNWWWLLMLGGVLGVFSAHFDLLEACCELGDRSKALIELASLITATLAGVMRASPINGVSFEYRSKKAAEKADTVRLKREDRL